MRKAAQTDPAVDAESTQRCPHQPTPQRTQSTHARPAPAHLQATQVGQLAPGVRDAVDAEDEDAVPLRGRQHQLRELHMWGSKEGGRQRAGIGERMHSSSRRPAQSRVHGLWPAVPGELPPPPRPFRTARGARALHSRRPNPRPPTHPREPAQPPEPSPQPGRTPTAQAHARPPTRVSLPSSASGSRYSRHCRSSSTSERSPPTMASVPSGEPAANRSLQCAMCRSARGPRGGGGARRGHSQGAAVRSPMATLPAHKAHSASSVSAVAPPCIGTRSLQVACQPRLTF